MNSLKSIKLKFSLLLLILGLSCQANAGIWDKLVRAGINQIDKQEKQNQQNDKHGTSFKNDYVIYLQSQVIAGDTVWISDRSGVLKEQINALNLEALRINKEKKFGNTRCYVIYLSKFPVPITHKAFLPGQNAYQFLRKAATKQADAEEIGQQLKIALSDIMTKSILNSVHYTDKVIYATGSVITFFQDRQQEERYFYDYVIKGKKLDDINAKAHINAVFQSTPADVYSDPVKHIEYKLKSLYTALDEIFSGSDKVTLAYKADNANVSSWYASQGTKETAAFSSSGNERVYDYTGLLIDKKQEILAGFADEKGKLIITDDATNKGLISNIKTTLVKTGLPTNVYWIHLDRSGQIQTEIFYSSQFLLNTPGASINAAVPDQLQAYIGNIYQQSAPQFRTISDIIDYFNVESRFLKVISSLFEDATISAKWWDSANADYVFAPLVSWAKYPELLMPLQNSLAFACGLWNGVVGNLKFVVDVMKALSDARASCLKIILDPAYREQMISDVKDFTQSLIANWSVYLDFGIALVSSKVSAEWDKITVQADFTSVYYMAGNIVIEYAITILTAGIVEGVKAVLYSVKGIRYMIDLLKYPVEVIAKYGRMFIKPFVWCLKQGLELGWDAGKYVLRQGTDIILEFGEQAGKVVLNIRKWVDEIEIDLTLPAYEFQWSPTWSMITPDGQTVTMGERVLQMVKTKEGKFGIRRRVLSAADEAAELLAKIEKQLPADYYTKFQDDFGSNVEMLRKFVANPKLVQAWKIVADMPDGKIWVRQNSHILEKMASLDLEYQVKLKEFYSTFNPNGPYPTIRNGINFDKYGFPEFPSEAIASISNNKYFSETLDGAVNGSKKDYEEAAKWFVKNNPNAQLSTGGQGIVVNGEYYVMHHMQDGKTIMPILQSIHDSSHTGGASLIRKGLKGVFSIP